MVLHCIIPGRSVNISFSTVLPSLFCICSDSWRAWSTYWYHDGLHSVYLYLMNTSWNVIITTIFRKNTKQSFPCPELLTKSFVSKKKTSELVSWLQSEQSLFYSSLQFLKMEMNSWKTSEMCPSLRPKVSCGTLFKLICDRKCSNYLTAATSSFYSSGFVCQYSLTSKRMT
jgi:hypothetical protein